MSDRQSTIPAGADRPSVLPAGTDVAAVRRPRGSVDPDRVAEVAATWEREIGSDPRDPVAAAAAGPVAKVDTLVPLAGVPTSDGSESYRLVVAGDRLPTAAELGGVPVSADASPAYRAKPGKPAA